LSTKRGAISRKTAPIAHFDDRHIAIAGFCLYDRDQLAEPVDFYRGHANQLDNGTRRVRKLGQ
jgi:hypothetical protein